MREAYASGYAPHTRCVIYPSIKYLCLEKQPPERSERFSGGEGGTLFLREPRLGPSSRAWGRRGAGGNVFLRGGGFYEVRTQRFGWIGTLVTLKLAHRDQGRAFSKFPRGLTNPFSKGLRRTLSFSFFTFSFFFLFLVVLRITLVHA